MNEKLTTAVRAYFADLRRIRASGGATDERSTYGPLANLLNAVGGTLKPKVFCVGELANQGAGHPDFGLYTAKQVQRGKPRDGQVPERGVVEVKAPREHLKGEAIHDQVGRYWSRYNLVLVTNLLTFKLVGLDATGGEATLESFRLADSEEAFDRQLATPRTFADNVGAALGEYLRRALSHRAAITDPKDLAWLLASYARDGLARVEAAEKPGRAVDSPLLPMRTALENGLGVRFEGNRGRRFFHSTLIQTLFYGVFSAWVLWARQDPVPKESFDWEKAVRHLRVPVLRTLFWQLSDPGRLEPLGLAELLHWTGAAIDRVDRDAFFRRFNEGDAVPYFYEPFLQAFDPDLRKQLGVWYTPKEVVRYMVARVDRALKDDLGISDGLADENVYVLDPCCGTGAYLAAVLQRIAANLDVRGFGALVGARVRQAALDRVFGFEIMPAPFVVAHLQVGLTLRKLDAPLEDDEERPAIYLTNSLTGWQGKAQEPLPFPELKEERDRAERVKQVTPILVILGNPPYNGYAGMAVDEERELSGAYRSTKRVRRPEGQGLNDLYVRFFRMAERRIAETTGRGVVCFISNYSWLDGLSFTGMRERYLEAFDAIRIDCLNGDKYKTGKVAPDGAPDPSIFSTEGDPVGIQVGTAIATLVRKADHSPAGQIGFRHLWGQAKREDLTATEELAPSAIYESVGPLHALGLPFAPTAVHTDWFDSPPLPDLLPMSFPGVKTSRDGFLIDTDLNRLRKRVVDYFDGELSYAEIARRYPAVVKETTTFKARSVREGLTRRGGPFESGFINFAYRPFDTRWLYWEASSGLLDRPRPDYRPHILPGNVWLSAAQHVRKGAEETQACFTTNMGSLHLIERGALMFPAWVREQVIGSEETQARANLSGAAQRYVATTGVVVEDIFYHVLATLHDPAYRKANAGALRMEWPRIPLPGWPDGNTEGAAEALARSAARGREIASLLDPEQPVSGVTRFPLRPEIGALAVPATVTGRNMAGEDFAVTAGWGHYGASDAVMPGQGRAYRREYTADERAKMGEIASVLGETTVDVHLNGDALWRNVPAAVWDYKLGGYQVLKKWLSYRERSVLGRALEANEVQHFTETVRRVGALLLLLYRRDVNARE